MSEFSDLRFMDAALALGRSGLGTTAPNPCVGCVIVKSGRVVGRGVTAAGGRPHAERVALDEAGKESHGATAYVTLEPCAHTGQTPPCADALVEAGIGRVVIACTDPDPRTAGQGISRLQEVGIEVVTGIRQAEAEQHHAGFFTRLGQGRPLMVIDGNPKGYDLAVDNFGPGGLQNWLKSPPVQELTRVRLIPGSEAEKAAIEANMADAIVPELDTGR
ncbi:bifunctional diaminohydroxyphosphoribosylaminopyrimidine deaminase/5-amino-6-(5-phosphoribosylamino)uracil reductase RibD [Hyphobacterium sp. HN65]|uniref:diaminohydroxyphosphoribosylaminopyrimidine deaminase n=1 Tax=Hyphobacterium lacteum TaxID=3116575 RepID=A0ABU7LR94_9PROT|nr:bifunctional diaminohydroxyphosphoribosylaminopyrimidine deaminase/5-amino-6-(5-phosphoribosylamino)uracil reductase RibD [Hyphobacterium sp. HN65]MEE2525839.1 bifunctional diaminohydroxyphosphoribosylaminopyrimidine deaminase/5-amino-6-(5-phosphoribosylamino)uracil reductase RibD [Hyphobacterium sp. HN65]